MKMNSIIKSTAAGLAIALFAGPALSADEPGTTLKFGGYAKFDAMFSDYSAGAPDADQLTRQFYLPLFLPTGTTSGTTDIVADFQARETRLNFRADTTTEGGNKITAFVEMDFFTHSDGNEILTNSFSPRLRHAFVKYNKWTFGQTWSTFQDVTVLPEALDFVGPAESTTFIRQSLIRYTTGNLELAVENPDAFVSGTFDTSPGTDTIPDLVARYSFKMSGGSYIRVAGLFRNLNVDQNVAGGDSADETAWGVSVSAKFKVGSQDDIRAMFTYGDGVGRYLGLGVARDAHYNSATDSLDTIKQAAGYVAYRHFWNDKWRSNIMYGTNSIDNPVSAGGGAAKSASSFHVNLIYNPWPKLDIGAEVFWAEKELESGEDGDLTRFMFSAKYAF
jgi:hypothetical protein